MRWRSYKKQLREDEDVVLIVVYKDLYDNDDDDEEDDIQVTTWKRKHLPNPEAAHKSVGVSNWSV